MNNYLILFPIILAMATGIGAYYIKFSDETARGNYAIGVTTAIAVSAAAIILLFRGSSVMLFSFTPVLNISLHIDGMSVIFGLMVCFLWPFAVIYATEYMKHEGKQQKFFTFYIMTFGVTLGLAFSANMLTLYLFYEMLTFITLPLVTHGMDARSKYAGSKYLIYSVSGASASFVGMMLLFAQTGSLDFVYGGLATSQSNVILVAYLLMFLGFGVKAAIFPFHAWLPGASVAPTTVTALLHAVAVVKAGVFAIMRTTFYFFGTDVLKGTWVQNAAMIFAIITICYGSWMAARSQHIKRRLAYSTISQLSYIVFGIALMSQDGFAGSLAHMLFHGLIKIVLFYSAGAILYTNHKEYVYEIEGYAKKMPKTFLLFTICSLALIGIPPLPGFLSKLALATGAAKVGAISFVQPTLTSILAFVGIIALMFSAFMTAIYLLEIVIKGYLPSKEFDESTLDHVKEAPNKLILPMAVITGVMVLSMFMATPLFNYIFSVAKGGF